MFVQYLGGIKKIVEAGCNYSWAKMLRKALSCSVLLLCSLSDSDFGTNGGQVIVVFWWISLITVAVVMRKGGNNFLKCFWIYSRVGATLMFAKNFIYLIFLIIYFNISVNFKDHTH